MGDVQKQRDLPACYALGKAAVGDAAPVQGGQARLARFLGQAGATVEPQRVIVAADAQGQVCLVAQFAAQHWHFGLQCTWGVDMGKGGTQLRKAGAEQLLIELDEVPFAGLAEQQSSGQGNGCSAGGEQQGQAPSQ